MLFGDVLNASNPKPCPVHHLTQMGYAADAVFHEPHIVLGHNELEKLVAPFRGDGSHPDCLVPFSGGAGIAATAYTI